MTRPGATIILFRAGPSLPRESCGGGRSSSSSPVPAATSNARRGALDGLRQSAIACFRNPCREGGVAPGTLSARQPFPVPLAHLPRGVARPATGAFPSSSPRSASRDGAAHRSPKRNTANDLSDGAFPVATAAKPVGLSVRHAPPSQRCGSPAAGQPDGRFVVVAR